MSRFCFSFFLLFCFFGYSYETVYGRLDTVSKIDLDDPEVRKKIIAQAIEVTWEKKADGSFLYYDSITRLRYQGTGWAVTYHDNGSLDALFQLKDGQDYGLLKGWYDNGKKRTEENWKAEQHYCFELAL